MTRVAMVAVGVVSFGAAFALGCGSLETQVAADETTTAVAAAGAAGQPTHDTATARAESPTPTPVLATPITTFDGAFMIVGGEVWVDAEPSTAAVRALIGGTECASGTAGLTPDDYLPRVTLVIPAAGERAGCGEPGSVVRFEIDGTPANQTLFWQPGVGVGLVLSLGPEGALYRGRILLSDAPRGVAVEPLVEGTVCGRQLNAFRGEGPYYQYVVVVFPTEIAPGCGRPGAQVTFRAVEIDAATGAVARILGPLNMSGTGWLPGERSEVAPAQIVSLENEPSE